MLQQSLLLALGLVIAIVHALPNPRVVGGKLAEEGEYPYQVSLQRKGRHFCGGSILSSRHILTAAHCAVGVDPEDFQVLVGTNSLKTGERYSIEDAKVHENFTIQTVAHDIAILRTSEDILFTETIQPINITTINYQDDKYPVTLTGWGRLWSAGPVPDELQKIELKLYDQEKCRKKWISYPYNIMINPGHICTLTKAGEGSCNGDSGGPLVANGVQVGIVSMGIPCARNFPDIFTRVYNYSRWISDAMTHFDNKI